MTINANGYTVNNVPPYATEKEFILARYCDGMLWFYGAWNDEEKALAVADEVGGVVIPLH